MKIDFKKHTPIRRYQKQKKLTKIPKLKYDYFKGLLWLLRK